MKHLYKIKVAFLFVLGILLYPVQSFLKPKGKYHNKYEIEYPKLDNLSLQADSTFLAKYSKKLGVMLDSCTNVKLITEVSSWLGAPYRYGGTTKRGTDCSGFVSSVYKQIYGLNLSHGGASMLSQMKQIIKRGKPLQEGDILFFRRGRRITHVGLYLSNHKFIHAATERRGVVVDDLRSPYYRKSFMVAGRPFPVKESQINY